MLAARRITYQYPHATGPALVELSATWRSGELCALVGPNGSGKTTLLRVLSGELKPHSGELLWNGDSMHRFPPEVLARRRAHLSQSPRLDFAFTVREVVALGRSPFRDQPERTEDAKRVASALGEVGLAAFAGRLYPELSRGEKQRVQLARVLAQLPSANPEASALFLDEPTNHLDLEHQHGTLQLARSRAREGRLVVAVLHDLNLALQYADRVIVLAAGRTFAEGEPRDVLTATCLADAFGVRAEVCFTSDGRPFLAIQDAVGNGRPSRHS